MLTPLSAGSEFFLEIYQDILYNLDIPEENQVWDIIVTQSVEYKQHVNYGLPSHHVAREKTKICKPIGCRLAPKIRKKIFNGMLVFESGTAQRFQVIARKQVSGATMIDILFHVTKYDRNITRIQSFKSFKQWFQYKKSLCACKPFFVHNIIKSSQFVKFQPQALSSFFPNCIMSVTSSSRFLWAATPADSDWPE